MKYFCNSIAVEINQLFAELNSQLEDKYMALFRLMESKCRAK